MSHSWFNSCPIITKKIALTEMPLKWYKSSPILKPGALHQYLLRKSPHVQATLHHSIRINY